jgi:hypothetical protein
VTEDIAAHLKAKAGLPRERFVLCCSHTHTAPTLGGTLPLIFGRPYTPQEKEHVDRYTSEFVEKLKNVSLAALSNRHPGKLAWARGQVGFATNRRVIKDGKWAGFGAVKDGPVEHDLSVLVATDTDGKLRAVLANYACHCTTLGGDFNKICGDWAGYAQEAIERDHPGALALIAIGCAADADPQPRLTLDYAKEHGDTVAREVSRLISGTLKPLPTEVTCRFRRIELPFATLPTREEWTARAKDTGPKGYHARVNLERLDRGESLSTTLPYEIQAISFGDDLAMVFLAGEVVVDYDLRLKRELDAGRLWVGAYSNAVPCYIASRRVLSEGGYEADDSMIYYDRPTRFAPEVEDVIVAAVRELVPKSFLAPPR